MRSRAALWGAIFIVFSAYFPGKAWAGIDVEPGFKGTLVITTSEGEILLIDEGDSVPSIESGALIEVFDGSFQLQAGEENDEARAACLGQDVKITGQSGIKLTCGEMTGRVEVLTGNATLMDGTTLSEGESHEWSAGATLEQAEPAGEGEPLGFAGDADLDDPDSRSIEITDDQDTPVTASF